MTIIKLLFFMYSIIHPLLFKTSWQSKTKVSPIMKQNQRQETSFCCALSHFIATYRNSLCRCCWLWSLFVSPQLKNFFVESKRLCQRIKHCVVVFISFCWIQNRYKEMNVIRSLFYRYIACNLHRVAMGVATKTCWVERLSSKRSRTQEILQDSKNKQHGTWNIIFIVFKYDF